MWIEDLPNGKYKYVERYEDPLTGKKRKVSMTHTKKNKRVEKELFIKLQEKIEKKLNETTTTLSLKELSQLWLEFYEPAVKKATYIRAISHLKGLNTVLGDVLLDNLTAAQINNYFLNGLKADNFKYNTAKQAQSIINRMCDYARKYHGYDLNHIKNNVEVPKINKTKLNKLKYLERDELKNILDYFEEHDMDEMKRMVLLQVNTGMRYSEMISLEYSDINFEEKSLEVRRSYDFDNKIFTSPKTGDERTVYFSDKIATVLNEQIKFSKTKTVQFNHPRDNTLLFKTVYGNPISTLTFNNALEKPNVPYKNVTSHYFRHTFVTMAIENKMDKNLIAKQVGHADTTMIEKIYSHFTENMEIEQKEAMKDFKII